MRKAKGHALCRSAREHRIKKGEDILVVKVHTNNGEQAFYCRKHWDEPLDKMREVLEEALIRKLAGIE